MRLLTTSLLGLWLLVTSGCDISATPVSSSGISKATVSVPTGSDGLTT